MEKRANANSRTEDLTTSSPQTPSCYETLFREKENALGLQDASGHVSNSRKAYAILRSLYRRYETITKINLYKDYANDYTRRPEKWDQLRQDIQNHETARSNVLALELADRYHQLDDESEVRLLRYAARLAVLEESELLQSSQDNEGDRDALAAVITSAKVDLALGLQSALSTSSTNTDSQEANRAHARAILVRLWYAIFSGMALIIPMAIMDLVGEIRSTLIIASLSILMVGVVFAVSMYDATNKDIVLATAAYAAVLTLFIGSAQLPGTYSPTQEAAYLRATGWILAVTVVGALLIIVATSLFVLLRGTGISWTQFWKIFTQEKRSANPKLQA